MRLEGLALDSEFCDQYGIADPSSILVSVQKLTDEEWEKHSARIVEKLNRADWWKGPAACAKPRHVGRTQISKMRFFPLTEEASASNAEILDALYRFDPPLKLPNKVRFNSAACARAAIETAIEMKREQGSADQPHAAEPKVKLIDFRDALELDATLREQETQIAELVGRAEKAEERLADLEATVGTLLRAIGGLSHFLAEWCNYSLQVLGSKEEIEAAIARATAHAD